MRRLLVTLIGSALIGVLIGCSGFDSTQVLVHPDTVATSATFDVVLVNLYTYMDTAGATISKDITRDSLHLMVGVPDGWEVVEAKAAVAEDMTTSALLSLQGSIVDDQTAAGLLAEYESRATVITADDGVAGALAGTTFEAHGGDSSIEVSVDDLEKTIGFSGPVAITIPKGSTADTTLSVEAMIALLDSTGMVADSTKEAIESLMNLPLSIPDSVGIVMVPVVVFLKLTAGEQVSDDTLYYFTKTGAINQDPSPIISTLAFFDPDMAQMLSETESGDLSYWPVTVVDAAAVTKRRAKDVFSGANVIADGGSGSVRISLGVMAHPATVVSVYSLRGTKVTTLGPQLSPTKSIVWNGTDFSGRPVQAGTYIFCLETTTVKKDFTAQLMR